MSAPTTQPSEPGGLSAISGSSSLVALRGRHLHLAGSYEIDGILVGAYVDDTDLRRFRTLSGRPSHSTPET
jgi:hypothetical protein